MATPASSSALFDSGSRPTGRFRLDVFQRGRLVEQIDEPNLVVASAAGITANLMAGAIAAPGLTQIGFGSSMTAPAAGNTGLTTPYLRPLDGSNVLTPGAATFLFSLPSAEANGLQIGEFGLFSAAGVLFARKVRATNLIPKDATISLSGSWTLQF